nr:MAG TPA: hypothetical protein [Bacteriophage sp.]
MSLRVDDDIIREKLSVDRTKVRIREHERTQFGVLLLHRTKIFELLGSLLFFGKVDKRADELADERDDKDGEHQSTDRNSNRKGTEVFGGDVVQVKQTRVFKHFWSFHRG